MKTLQTSSMEKYRQPNNSKGLLLGLLAAVVIAAAMSLCLGPVRLPLGNVLSVLFHSEEKVTVAGRILLYSRLPRTCGCLLAGTALAVSGTVIQTVLDNPLAAPNVIGVNAGAGLAVTLWGAFLPARAGVLPLAAFCGALCAVLLVLFIGERTGASRLTLILAGVAVSAVFTGAVELVISLVPDALGTYTDFRIGGFAGVTMRRVLPAAPVIVIALAVVLALSGDMDVLALGDDTARSLGLRTRPVRFLLLTCAAALAGAAVSIAGLLGFVGLIVPHGLRKLTGGESLWLVLCSALGGAALVTVCDLLARLVFAPYELPVGVLLSLIGGPFFLYVILCQRGGRRRA